MTAAPAVAAASVAPAAVKPATPPVVAVAKPPAAAKPAAAASEPAAKDEVGTLLDSKPAPANVKKADAAKAESKKAEPAKTAEAKTAAKPAKDDAPAPVASLAHGAAVVQFGAFSSSVLAGTEWAKLAKAYPADMSGKGRLVESVERDGKTLYRGAVSGFASKADAVAFCAKLKTDSRACIVK